MMPKVEINADYSVRLIESRKYVLKLDILTEFLEVYEIGDFHSENELKTAFKDFIISNYDLIPGLPFDEEFEELNFIDVLNWDEIYLALAHLISVDYKKECCRIYSSVGGYHYCPICGTKY